jgi:DNA-binding transcriptional MocR family regulator
VIYVGSLSKVLTPALRIGWIAADASLINKLVLLKQASDQIGRASCRERVS